jgi:hypothetical protein
VSHIPAFINVDQFTDNNLIDRLTYISAIMMRIEMSYKYIATVLLKFAVMTAICVCSSRIYRQLTMQFKVYVRINALDTLHLYATKSTK